MKEPNLDAAIAWDFIAWCNARHPDRADMEALAEEYEQDCANGSWPIAAKDQALAGMAETGEQTDG